MVGYGGGGMDRGGGIMMRGGRGGPPGMGRGGYGGGFNGPPQSMDYRGGGDRGARGGGRGGFRGSDRGGYRGRPSRFDNAGGSNPSDPYGHMGGPPSGDMPSYEGESFVYCKCLNHFYFCLNYHVVSPIASFHKQKISNLLAIIICLIDGSYSFSFTTHAKLPSIVITARNVHQV